MADCSDNEPERIEIEFCKIKLIAGNNKTINRQKLPGHFVKCINSGKFYEMLILNNGIDAYGSYTITIKRAEMNKIIQFGENVEGYSIPVLNEREIRAAAGLLFLMMFISIGFAAVGHNFLMLKYAIVIFMTDILIRVVVNPKYSPFLIIGRLIVRNQTPEYVGAKQKKFAWIIGIVLAIIMLILQVIVNSYSPITGMICLICLIFLFFESAFGICLGCKFYSWVYKEKAQYCPGEVCEVKDRQDIQKTSGVQVLIILGFIAYVFLIIALFNGNFSKKPFDLLGINKAAQSGTK